MRKEDTFNIEHPAFTSKRQGAAVVLLPAIPTVCALAAMTIAENADTHGQAGMPLGLVIFFSLLGALGAVLAFFLWGFRVGRKHSTPWPFRRSWQGGIDILRQQVYKRGEEYKKEGFPGVQKAGRQLWVIGTELERLERWLGLYFSSPTDREEILSDILAQERMEIDTLFLRHVVASEALFDDKFRERCRTALSNRLGQQKP